MGLSCFIMMDVTNVTYLIPLIPHNFIIPFSIKGRHNYFHKYNRVGQGILTVLKRF